MDKLPSIPTPLRLRWREFCVGLGPYLVFGLVLILTVSLWRQANGGRTAAGIAEGTRATVSSPLAGRLVELRVQPYQLVQRGEAVAIVMPVDPRASLDLWRGEMDLLRLRMQPSLAEQNALSYERLRLELAGTRSELAIARVNLQRAEHDLARNEPLFREQLVSEDVYDLSLQTRDALQAEVAEKASTVAEIEDRISQLRALADPSLTGAADQFRGIVERLDQAHGSLSTNWGPIVLEAPISGMIGAVFRQQGEHIVDGEPLVSICSMHAERVVAYLRQPYAVEPAAGMPVTVTSRNRDRTIYETGIAQVGTHVEVITNALAYVKPGALVDVGLPVVMMLPPDNRIRAGELVDVHIRGTPRKPFRLFGAFSEN